MKDLVGEMNAGKVDLLIIMGTNPVYDAPADFDFAAAMNKVPLRVQHSLYQDETSDHVHWHINATHYLEEWGDARAFDGTYSIVQPLIAPLYNGKSEYEFISSLIGSSETAGYDIVRKYWQGKMQGGDFETQWRKALNDGFIANTVLPAKNVSAKGGNIPASEQRWQWRRHGGHLPSRPANLRRQQGQQWMAAGDTKADH